MRPNAWSLQESPRRADHYKPHKKKFLPGTETENQDLVHKLLRDVVQKKSSYRPKPEREVQSMIGGKDNVGKEQTRRRFEEHQSETP